MFMHHDISSGVTRVNVRTLHTLLLQQKLKQLHYVSIAHPE